jgi:hypothetical protein
LILGGVLAVSGCAEADVGVSGVVLVAFVLAGSSAKMIADGEIMQENPTVNSQNGLRTKFGTPIPQRSSRKS